MSGRIDDSVSARYFFGLGRICRNNRSESGHTAKVQKSANKYRQKETLRCVAMNFKMVYVTGVARKHRQAKGKSSIILCVR